MFNNTDSKFIWKNGKFQKWNESTVHLMSHTLNYGTGAFEGVRAYKTEHGPAIFRLQDHTDRLFNTARKIDIEIPYSKEELNEAQKNIFIENNLDEGYIRPIVYLGAESLGIRAFDLSVNVAVAAWEWPSYMDPEAKERGISIIKSSYEQYSNPLHSGNKIIGTYINSTMALHEAIKAGADEALLMDKDGFISEGSGENIFIVDSNNIYTPTINHCLNGITRQSVITIAKDEGFNVIEKDLTYQDLVNADEAFFTGTAVEITPITKIDNLPIGSGRRGEITHRLQSIYEDVISANSEKYRSWLSFAKPLKSD